MISFLSSFAPDTTGICSRIAKVVRGLESNNFVSLQIVCDNINVYKDVWKCFTYDQ